MACLERPAAALTGASDLDILSPVRHVTRAEMIALDRRAIEEFGIPSLLLMENAGRAVADVVDRLSPAGVVRVVCGAGSNGGDGLVAARHLHNRGYDVTVLLLGEPPPGSDAGVNLRIARKLVSVGGDAACLAEPAGAIVDAIFGTGLSRPVAGPPADVIARINAVDRRASPVVSVDLPSGLDADAGEPLGSAVRASITVTLGLPKVGFQNPKAAPYVGRLVVADIGIPRELLA